jgi:hypothetical protein
MYFIVNPNPVCVIEERKLFTYTVKKASASQAGCLNASLFAYF